MLIAKGRKKTRREGGREGLREEEERRNGVKEGVRREGRME